MALLRAQRASLWSVLLLASAATPQQPPSMASGGSPGGAAVALRPCGEANATGWQTWTIGDANNQGPIGLAGADLWLALAPGSPPTVPQPRVVLSRNRSAALSFDFLPAGHGQRGTEAWIRTTGHNKWPLGLCLDDFSSAPHHPTTLPVGGIFLGGCDVMNGAETWVALGAEHWSTRHKPHWLVCGSTADEQCLTALTDRSGGT